MVDRDGVIHYAPNVPGFLGTPVRAEIAAGTGLPTVVDNDANAAAWGELVHGAARGVRDALVITLGTGIGGGIVSRRSRAARRARLRRRGRALHDRPARSALRVRRGRALGGGGVGDRARSDGPGGRASRRRRPAVLEAVGGDGTRDHAGTHVSAAARGGAPDALALIDRVRRGRRASGFVGLANILDPEVIVVSGGLVEEGDLLLGPVRRLLRRSRRGRARTARRRTIVAAALGDRAGDGRRRGHGPGAARDDRRTRVKVGITLPSFRDDPEIPLAVAVAAEAAGCRRRLRVRPPLPARGRRSASGLRSSAPRCSGRWPPRPVGSRSGRSSPAASLRPAATLARRARHRAARERRPAHRRGGRRRLREPARERDLRPRLRYPRGARSPRSRRRSPTLDGPGLPGLGRWERRARRRGRGAGPTVGTAGAANPTAFASEAGRGPGALARRRRRSRPDGAHDVVGRAGGARRDRRRRPRRRPSGSAPGPACSSAARGASPTGCGRTSTRRGVGHRRPDRLLRPRERDPPRRARAPAPGCDASTR